MLIRCEGKFSVGYKDDLEVVGSVTTTDRGRGNMIVPSKRGGKITRISTVLNVVSLSSVSLVLSLRRTDMDSECLGTRFDYKLVIIRYNDVTRNIIMVLFTTGRLLVYIKNPGSIVAVAILPYRSALRP